MDGINSGFELPQPQVGPQPEQGQGAHEVGPATPEQSTGLQASSIAIPPTPPIDPISGSLTTSTLPMPPLPSAGAPPIAEDTDLIEKEWVIRAKEIVAKTKQDPHAQNHEISKFKAEYMKKRYNKDVKVTEE